jgi:hypothetical protein
VVAAAKKSAGDNGEYLLKTKVEIVRGVVLEENEEAITHSPIFGSFVRFSMQTKVNEKHIAKVQRAKKRFPDDQQ